MSKVTLIDYEIGNLLSVERALRHIGADFSIARTADEIKTAEKLILPGVGAFASCVNELEKRGFSDPIREAVAQDKPLFGICVGMQMLFDKSEEFGEHEGFGFIQGTVKAIPSNDINGVPHKTPHIGWTSLTPPENYEAGWDSSILKGVPSSTEVYFVHSFAAHPADERDRVADSHYGGRKICSIVGKNNIFGAQFHPEKSGPIGLKMLENFINI